MLWPVTAERADGGSLWIGGVAVAALAAEHGTPLYIFDVATIRAQCRAYTRALASVHERSRVVYAGKAWICPALLQIIAEEGLSLDVVSGGELFVALHSGFPPEKIAFHGNNKSPSELRMAIDAGIGEIVIDNFDEIRLLAEMSSGRATPIDVLIRLNPGIDVHTHDYRKTGIVDSKFGLGIATGDAANRCRAHSGRSGIAAARVPCAYRVTDLRGCSICRDGGYAVRIRRDDARSVRIRPR